MALKILPFSQGAGKKTGISEIRYIDMDISEIDTFDDVISDIDFDISRSICPFYSYGLRKSDMDISISDISRSICPFYSYGYIEKHIDFDISRSICPFYSYGYIGNPIWTYRFPIYPEL